MNFFLPHSCTAAVGQENYPQALDDFSFDEDSSDALSPDQPASQESQGSAASPGEPKTREAPSPITPISSANQVWRQGSTHHCPFERSLGGPYLSLARTVLYCVLRALLKVGVVRKCQTISIRSDLSHKLDNCAQQAGIRTFSSHHPCHSPA